MAVEDQCVMVTCWPRYKKQSIRLCYAAHTVVNMSSSCVLVMADNKTAHGRGIGQSGQWIQYGGRGIGQSGPQTQYGGRGIGQSGPQTQYDGRGISQSGPENSTVE